MIRIEAMWLAVDPVNMRAGADRLIASGVQVIGAAQAHHGYPMAFLHGWRGTITCDDYKGYYAVLRA